MNFEEFLYNVKLEQYKNIGKEMIETYSPENIRDNLLLLDSKEDRLKYLDYMIDLFRINPRSVWMGSVLGYNLQFSFDMKIDDLVSQFRISHRYVQDGSEQIEVYYYIIPDSLWNKLSEIIISDLKNLKNSIDENAHNDYQSLERINWIKGQETFIYLFEKLAEKGFIDKDQYKKRGNKLLTDHFHFAKYKGKNDSPDLSAIKPKVKNKMDSGSMIAEQHTINKILDEAEKQ